MTARRRRPEPLDLADGAAWRVRLIAHPDGGGPPEAVWEGETTFSATPMPYVARLGDRWEVVPSCRPGLSAVAGTHPGGEYRPGGDQISFGERWAMLLLDRRDPLLPYGPGGPTLREAVAMAVDVFFSAEGVDVAFADDGDAAPGPG